MDKVRRQVHLSVAFPDFCPAKAARLDVSELNTQHLIDAITDERSFESLLSRATEVQNERIRQRAYEIFLKRGAIHGYDLDDWLRAKLQTT
jgi:hypothetical protein